ncbi:MAG TPA: hypothetical protein VFB72_20570 [Verrucomicrobiae bacterium]|nr:hypothetical protein [Verrucomicrobiae bacterium]
MAYGVATPPAPPRETEVASELRPDGFHGFLFELLAGGAFVTWGLFIYFSRKQNILLKREDIVELAQTTSALAGITLAAVAFLQAREKLLKLFLAALTVIFVLATTVAWLTVMLVGEAEGFKPVHLRFAGVIGIVFSIYGYVRLLFARLVSEFGSWSRIRVVWNSLVFVLPFAVVGVWPEDTSSYGPAAALSVGGMIYLVAAAIFLIVAVNREVPVAKGP